MMEVLVEYPNMTTDPFGGPPVGGRSIGGRPIFRLRLESFSLLFFLSFIEEGMLLPNSIDQCGLDDRT